MSCARNPSRPSPTVLLFLLLLPPPCATSRPTLAGALEGIAQTAAGGDVNGDATVDISDASALLNWLFLGGPAPQPCGISRSLAERLEQLELEVAAGDAALTEARAGRTACEEDLARCDHGPTALPDTGQTTCFVSSSCGAGAPSPCEGDDAAYPTGCPMQGRFVDNRDGTVTDRCTGLLWQKDTADVDGNGQHGNEEDRATWCQALAHCESLTFAAHNNWRLPDVRELQSLLHYGRGSSAPAVASVFRTSEYPYWSSTTSLRELRQTAFQVGFDEGNIVDIEKSTRNFVRAVRRAPLAAGIAAPARILGGEAAAAAGAAGGTSSVPDNGDINGDGTIDISDASAILNWLFLGGSAPRECGVAADLLQQKLQRIEDLEAQLAAIESSLAETRAAWTACVEALAACDGIPFGVPDTGLTQCFGSEAGDEGALVACAEAVCPGQDGAHDTGCPIQGRFVDNRDGTVTDRCTGLLWQQLPTTALGGLSWCDAITHCEDLVLAGHDDWRLPDVRELHSIIDYGRVKSGNALAPAFRGRPGFYWSSTTSINGSAVAYAVDTGNGRVEGLELFRFHLKINSGGVRAVRTAP